jgi:plasmid stabilization system protein ParE
VTEYQVIIESEADDVMYSRAKYIAIESGSKAAGQRYYNAVYDFCQSLSTLPRRYRKRDDLRSDIRIAYYQGSTVSPYLIDEKTKIVHILNVLHSSQDYEDKLRQPD